MKEDNFQNASSLKLAPLAQGAAGAATAEMLQCPEVSMR